jgi:hypothetical protein
MLGEIINVVKNQPSSTQTGKGWSSKNGEGLYTNEINKICKSLGLYNYGFLGAIWFDELNDMMINITDKKYNFFSFIINTSNNANDNKNMKHWTTIFCDGVDFCYYDP